MLPVMPFIYYKDVALQNHVAFGRYGHCGGETVIVAQPKSCVTSVLVDTASFIIYIKHIVRLKLRFCVHSKVLFIAHETPGDKVAYCIAFPLISRSYNFTLASIGFLYY